MMFQFFEAIADRVRDQVAEYAGAQARIGARVLAHVANPLAMEPAAIEPSLAAPPPADTDLCPPRPTSKSRLPHGSAAKRPSRRERRAALNFA